ncbi:HAMP domain-containing protein [Oxalobacteraceae bacterium OM1]|nr:HAMP domain-containing protein [Oxalobacteraceae bacterium OM1]
MPEERRLAEAWYAQSGGLGIERIGETIKAISEERWDNAESILIKDINPTYRKADTALTALEDALAAREKERSATVADDIARIKGVTAAVIVGSLLLALVVGLLLVRSITIPLTRAVEVARRVAEGDLTCDISASSTNEIGQLLEALKTMNSGLTNIVSDVRSATQLIGTASNEIASGNMDLSSRTEQQASSLAETASSMEQLTGTVQQNGENARHANQLAQSASEVAVRGGAVVSEVVSTMGSINESARKIVDIIGVIDSIAFQTNILALNAAVEAARAGDQGRGFAVVASEVRSLAQRSASAAKEIKTLIGDSVEKVETGTRLVDEAGATMQEIVASVKRVTDIMAEIASASEEQSTGIEQIGQAVTQMDQMTQQNAALVEQAAAAAAAMETQAQHLAQAISIFRLHDALVMQSAPAVSIPVLRPAAAVKQPTRVTGGRRLQSISH